MASDSTHRLIVALVIPLYDFNDPSPASSIPSSIALSPSTCGSTTMSMTSSSFYSSSASPSIRTTTTTTRTSTSTTSATSSTRDYDFLQYQQLQLPPFIPYSDHSSVIKETEKEERKLLLPAPIVLPIVIMSPEDRQRKLFVSTRFLNACDFGTQGTYCLVGAWNKFN